MAQIIFTLLFVIHAAVSLHIGDKCHLDNNVPGFCTRIQKCPSATKEWQQGIIPEICGVKGTKIIVCCPLYQKAKVPKSELKCSEYAVTVPQIRNREKRSLVGGERSLPQEFSHMAALGYKNGGNIVWRCGGTLISDQYVLTAAHCLRTREYGAVKYVRLGDLDLDSEDDDASPQTFRVAFPISHPGYKKSMKYNDIGLIKLDKKVVFTKHVHPACLYTQQEMTPTKMTAVGWGPATFGTDKSNILMKVDLDLFSDEACRTAYMAQNTLEKGIQSESQFCAGGKNEIRDTCKGDSGGPLLMPTNDHPSLHYIVGIISSGKLCGYPNTPGVYTRVSHFVPWIESVVWP